MNKSFEIETFTLQETATGCKTIPAAKAHPLLSKLHGDDEEAVHATIENKFPEVLQRIVDIAPRLGVAVLEVRKHEQFAEFDVCAIEQWEAANALDLGPVLASKGIPLAAKWLPDGRIVLPSTPTGGQWIRFQPNSAFSQEQNLQAVAEHVQTLLPDVANTFFNLKDFLEKNGNETPYEFGRGLYKYTECGPWTAFNLVGQPGESNTVYYEDKLAHQSETEQTWWDRCCEIEIGSIVEGSDVEISPQTLAFPFTRKSLDEAVSAVNEEASFYWSRDNCSYFEVVDTAGKTVMTCQWVDWDDAPTGSFEESDAESLALAIAARKALEDPAVNKLASEHMRSIDHEALVPIPGTKYFVRELETPDYIY